MVSENQKFSPNKVTLGHSIFSLLNCGDRARTLPNTLKSFQRANQRRYRKTETRFGISASRLTIYQLFSKIGEKKWHVNFPHPKIFLSVREVHFQRVKKSKVSKHRQTIYHSIPRQILSNFGFFVPDPPPWEKIKKFPNLMKQTLVMVSENQKFSPNKTDSGT